MISIFVSITSFCDPHLRFTLESIFNTAALPETLRPTVIDQSLDGNREWIRAQPWADQVQYIQVNPIDSRGCSWARSVAFSCYRGEDYVLQIDSHTHFEQYWDHILRDQLLFLRTLNKKAAVTAYPPPFDFDEAGYPIKTLPPGKEVFWLRPMDDQVLKEDNLTLLFKTDHVADADFVVAHHMAGGLLFTTGDFVHDVPYDPFMYYHGDEQNMALRAFTRGWTLYHPRHMNIPLYHLYKTQNVIQPSQHWRTDLERERTVKFEEFKDRARVRLLELVRGARGDQAYGLGSFATVADFAAESGINYLDLTLNPVEPIRVLRTF